MFDINGVPSTVEDSVAIIKDVAPQMQVRWSGDALPFPMDLSDEPVRAHLGDYGSVPVRAGIERTYAAFKSLLSRGLLKADSIN